MPSYRSLQDYLGNPVTAPAEAEEPAKLDAMHKEAQARRDAAAPLFDDMTGLYAKGADPASRPLDNPEASYAKLQPKEEEPEKPDARSASLFQQALSGDRPSPVATPAAGGSGPAPAPAPAPKKAKGKGVSVSEVPAREDNSFLKASAAAPALAQSMPAPKAESTGTVTPAKPQPTEEDELAAAQKKAAQEAGMSHLGGLLAGAGRDMLGLSRDDAPYARGEAMAQQGVKDLLQRRDAARQAQADSEAKAAQDPDSPQSKLATQLAQARGLIPPGQKVSLAQWGLIKDSGSVQEAKDKLASEERRAELERTSREKEGAANRQNQRVLESMRAKAELDKERIAKANAANGKPINEQEAAKVVNQGQAVPQIERLKQLQKDVGPSGLLAPLGIHIGAEGRYNDAVNNLAPGIAAGAAPAARENAGLMEEFKKGFPKGYNDSDRAEAAFNELEGAVARNRAAQVAALKAGGYNPAQVAELERQGGAAPTQPTPAAAHPQASAALAWAQAHKDDPRAAEILRRVGGP